MNTSQWLTAVVLSLALTTTAAHEGDDHGEQQPAAGRVLGDISFPTTAESESAQSYFIQGMLLMHLFEYPFAEQAFQRAQSIDPDFAMAYWGEAMTHNHPIWDEQDRDKARAVLARLGGSAEARRSKTNSRKEQDYLDALDILYGDGPKARRDEDYSRHMAIMAANYPDDDEVQLFHALSLFGTTAGVRDIPTYMEATAIAQRIFYGNREHPGAAHYLIHGVDDPVHAPLGLEAARALAVMAPDAGHSLHMTSHIFTALGLWDDVVTANTEASRVANAMRAEQGEPARSFGHYNFWLLYGLLQQGRQDDAERLLRAAYRDLEDGDYPAADRLKLDPDRSALGSVVQMWARFLIESRGAGESIDPDILAWTFELGDAFDPALTWHYTQALMTEDVVDIDRLYRSFRDLEAELRDALGQLERQAPSDLLYLDRLAVMNHELKAHRARASGDLEAALVQAREASRLEGEMPFSFGPPFVDLPSAEMLGMMLLDAKRFDEAVEALTVALERTRLKATPLLGLAKAERGRGNADAAEYAMAQYRRVRD